MTCDKTGQHLIAFKLWYGGKTLNTLPDLLHWGGRIDVNYCEWPRVENKYTLMNIEQ